MVFFFAFHYFIYLIIMYIPIVFSALQNEQFYRYIIGT